VCRTGKTCQNTGDEAFDAAKHIWLSSGEEKIVGISGIGDSISGSQNRELFVEFVADCVGKHW
jgi:hypothetical protein